jgi:hypothetical protein
VKGASDLRDIKRQAILALTVKYPEWAEAFSNRDSGKWQKKISAMKDIVNATDYPELQGRPEIQGLSKYMQARDALIVELKNRDAAGGAKTLDAVGNKDLSQLWESIVGRMVADNPAFSQLYFRYLEHDPMGA